MFLKLFSSAARPPGKTLAQIREEFFDTHSAPPPGVSAVMADRVRAIHSIDSFPKFLAAMGIADMPAKLEFTAFLRRTIADSMNAGYSCMPMSQSQLYASAGAGAHGGALTGGAAKPAVGHLVPAYGAPTGLRQVHLLPSIGSRRWSRWRSEGSLKVGSAKIDGL
ncbi:hypothetical protein BU23DRAFT_548527 [Bimuria novae-zelandiae CBS 107.79]|uniref:Uncharacterized protein n=1 Tax=Bimuria novae-zelandiae CBS 107.79 TaxID=1447943 RepID=A0A6A5VSN5_9PLEO|nr:hypothetical protein BU23DRAFT_548527 [Bimuria novae-zelandiae CBS 107.79]